MRGKKKQKDSRGTLKLQWQCTQYHWKDLNKMNLTTPRKIINNNWSGLHELLKSGGWFTYHWMTSVDHSSHRWWPILLPLYSSHRDLFGNTDGVIIKSF